MAANSSEDISTKVQASLANGPYACSSLEKLSGGTANFVYRGVLRTPLEDGAHTVVIKHTEPYVASNPAFKLTSTRCEFEESILSALQTLAPSTYSNITIQTPRMYYFSSETNTQIYSDLPASTELKTYALTHTLTNAQCSRLGHSLGIWAKTFHVWAQAPEQEKLRETIKGNVAMKELKFQVNYQTLVATVDRFPEILENSKSVFESVRDDVRSTLDTHEGVLIHGDFWSGNVLLPNSPLSDEEHTLKMFIIDWELTHLSSVAFDLGQMIAELFELKHFKDIDAGVWLIESFMAGYGTIEDDLAFKTAIHLGTHLICWGSRVAGWGTEEQIKDVVRIGKEFVVSGWEKDRRFFDGTVLRCLFT